MPILDMPVLDMPETSLQSPQSAYIETIDDRLSKDLALSDSEDDETEENTQILTFTPKYFSTPKNMSEDNIHKSKTEENIHMSKTEENINIETTIEKMKAGFRFMGTATAVHKSKTEDNIHKSKTEKNIHTEDNINIKTTIEKMKEQSLSPNLRGLRGFHVPNKPSASRIPPPPRHTSTPHCQIHMSKREENIQMSKTEENVQLSKTEDNIHMSKTEENIQKLKTGENIQKSKTEEDINMETTIEKIKEQSPTTAEKSPNLVGCNDSIFSATNKLSASRIPPPPTQFFYNDEKLRDTPSVRAGYSIEKEQRYRREMCSFIQVCLCSFS